MHDPSLAHDALLEPLREMLARDFAIFHTTLQLEAVACAQAAEGDNYAGPFRAGSGSGP